VLVVILCLFGVGVIGVVGLGAFVFHKAKQAGIDSELWRTNPGAAVGRMMAAVNPNLEVVRTNDADRTVILRDRHTGKQFRIAIDSARNGSLSLQADDDGKSARIDIGEDAKTPGWVPKYPGSRIQPGFSASGDSREGSGEAGTFVFKTSDRGSRVLEFYEQKAREMGLELHTLASDGKGVIAAGDAERDRYFKVVIIGGSDETTVNVTYARKR
jgi:hypothetical protein